MTEVAPELAEGVQEVGHVELNAHPGGKSRSMNKTLVE